MTNGKRRADTRDRTTLAPGRLRRQVAGHGILLALVLGAGAAPGARAALAQGEGDASRSASVGTPLAAESAQRAPAADPEAVAAVARRLNCPVCQGYTLQDCPLVVCSQMRALIAEQLAGGASDEAIMADFVAEYGPQVLNEPPRSGFHLIAWILPVVALLVAASVAAGAVTRDRRINRGAALTVTAPWVDSDQPESVSDEARQRIEDLVARR